MSSRLFNQTHLNNIQDADCTLKINAKDITTPTVAGSGDVCVIYAPTNGVINSVGMYNNGLYSRWSVEGEGKRALYTAQGNEGVSSINIDVEIVEPSINVDFATDDDIQLIHDKGCRLFANGVEVVENTKLLPSDGVYIEANDGWIFLPEQSSAGFYASGVWVSLELSEDKKRYYVPTSMYGNIPHFNEWEGVSLEQVAGDVVGGFNNVYNISREEANDLAHDIFYDRLGGIAGDDTVVDWGSYVINLMMLPFEIPEEIILGKEVIQLGKKSTNTKANKIATDLIKFDLGVISVPSVEGNVLDYSNTVALLHLPFIDPIGMELTHVIGEDIRIRFEIDAYSGLGTYIVDSDKSGTNLFMKTVNLAVNIPFMNVGADPETIFSSSIEIGGDNGVREPQIEIIRNNSPLAKGFFSAPILDDGLLKDQSGFVVVDNVDLKSVALSEEKAMIESILKNGVIL